MDIILRRKVKSECFRLLMKISKKGKRDDIIAVLMLARENGGYIRPEDVCSELIANRPISVGKRIIDRCVDLNLLEWIEENKASLTNSGNIAVDERFVFLPEMGLYQIVYSDDPLIPTLIYCQPDEWKDEFDKQAEEINSNIITKLINKRFQTIGKNRSEIYIEKIKPIGRRINKEINLNLTCSFLENRKVILNVNGSFQNSFKPPNDVTQTDIWQIIIESMCLSEDWDSDLQCLKIRFNELKPKELSSFLRDFNFKNLNLDNLGEFEEVIIKNVPITPKGRKDAQMWAIWLLENEITGYLSAAEYDNIIKKIENKFSYFQVNLPTQEELAKRIREKSPTKIPPAYWYLKAPLSLSEVI